MIDWQKTAASVIGEVHRSLPADADLETRRKALRAAKPYEFAVTSWGRKVWAKHQRKYLEKFGLPPLGAKVAKEHLSPLERLMAKSKAAPTPSLNHIGEAA
jgi:hypothetical protein